MSEEYPLFEKKKSVWTIHQNDLEDFIFNEFDLKKEYGNDLYEIEDCELEDPVFHVKKIDHKLFSRFDNNGIDAILEVLCFRGKVPEGTIIILSSPTN